MVLNARTRSSLPVCLQHLPKCGRQAGWLQELGPRGPWVIERIIGMREFPQGLDCEGKVAMLEECVRRACQSQGGEFGPKLHQHVRGQMRVWRSYGADLQVPMAASVFFSWASILRLGRIALGPETGCQFDEGWWRNSNHRQTSGGRQKAA